MAMFMRNVLLLNKVSLLIKSQIIELSSKVTGIGEDLKINTDEI